MFSFITQRLLSAIISAWLVATIVFVLIRLIPGDPAIAMAGPTATAEEIEALRSYLRLDDPLLAQYGRFMGNLARGDLGTSVRTNQPVMDELIERFPATLEVSFVALVLVLIVAIPLGIVAAVRRNSLFDHASRIGTLIGVGIPVFWLGILLVWVFAYKLRLLPVGGRLDVQLSVDRVSGFVILDALLLGQPSAAGNALKHLVLPSVVLALAPLAIVARLMRGSLLEVLGEDYIRTAYAKGLRGRVVIVRHAMRNALQPVITILGLQLAALLTGAVLVENIFAWPGVGAYVYNALQTRDYPVVQGTVILIALMYVAINTVIDVGYGVLDPRTRAALRGAAA